MTEAKCPKCFPAFVWIAIEPWQCENVICPGCDTEFTVLGDDGYDDEPNEEHPYFWLVAVSEGEENAA